ncbi:hypothetical protein DL237_00125 [Pseudooceanicola sediminis]|uniref:Lipoprotein n=1 Tax=Pseudooceanicola sediminis TaxID=2211117 RepID=A0A399J566_9RHOB|nr:hypothetical protein [Pseudooceanicola sediminis]KAA2317179.1 hypothetical protein E0K93_02415 [Puniceibacterium sp. HSS470]RII40471.1 hypothetical protein DL237_00125 [Pseudooceanicola sediminis]|tara:strand:- start:56116 stop:56628 length:513 start_codon:yes stop_codon:yes gene_type:complete
MRKTIPVVVIAALSVAGCATIRDSRANPANWFGRTQTTASASTSGTANPLIPDRVLSSKKQVVDLRTPVARIDTLDVEQVPGGAIIRVSATSAYQGAFKVGLVPQNAEGPVDGVARYTLMAYLPATRTSLPVGTEASRKVVAATRLSDIELADVRKIEVVGGLNALSQSR